MSRIKQIVVPIVVLAAGIGIFIVLSGMKKPPEEKVKKDNTPIVSVTEITLAPVALNVTSHGVVKPKYETVLVAQVSGELVELSAKFIRGGFVAKGEVLAKIDANDYQAELIDAQANLASAKASLMQEVAQGKVAEKEWKRITESLPTALSLRKPQLAKELAKVEAAKARVMLAERNLERTIIKAPYDALIEYRDQGLGAYISKGTKIGKVLSTDVAEIRLPVAENQLPFLIQQGEKAKVNIIGSFAGLQHQWTANIVRSEGVIDSTSRMNYLVAELADPYGLSDDKTPLRFGSYVNAVIAGREIDNVAVIPRYLLLDNGVPVIDNDNKLRFVAVDVVRQQGKNVIVANGLVNGDKMITSALDYPLDGMQLALAESINVESPAASDEISATKIAQVKD